MQSDFHFESLAIGGIDCKEAKEVWISARRLLQESL